MRTHARSRRLTHEQQSVVLALARWRERTAQESDLPRGWVLPDNAVLDIAREMPGNANALGSIESFSSKLRERWGRFLMSVIDDGRRNKNKIEPLLVFYDETRLTDFSLKINLNDVSRTISEIEKKWNLLFPEREFGYFFLEDSFARLYQEEKQLGNLVLYFSLLAVFIGCLGLFGLVSFTAEQRSKEIGIRKVLGARISSIVMLLSKEFMILVLISCLIAWPLAWYGLQQWLNNFAYHIKLGPTPLVISGLIALTISWLTVSYQALKAAMANPVMTIRNQ